MTIGSPASSGGFLDALGQLRMNLMLLGWQPNATAAREAAGC